jgi:hypothetical protein
MRIRSLLFWIFITGGVIVAGGYSMFAPVTNSSPPIAVVPNPDPTTTPSQEPVATPTITPQPEVSPTPIVVTINNNLEREPQMVIINGKDGVQKSYTWTDGSSISLSFDQTPDGKTKALLTPSFKDTFPKDRKFKAVWGDIPKASNSQTIFDRKGKPKNFSDLPPEGVILEIDGDYNVGLSFLAID